MSDIPRAREIIKMVLKLGKLGTIERRHLHKALALMVREPPIRRASRHRIIINGKTRRKIQNLSRTDMTMHQIATATGVHNMGRIHDVLTGKR